MGNPFLERVERVFHQARALPAGERPAFLASACGTDRRLLDQVQQLLSAHEGAGAFLEPPTMADTVAVPLDPLVAPARVGHYRVLEEIGSGGFGTVYMAEQDQPFRRKVALKILNVGMNTREVVARFEAERQALALMDHPNISSVFDAGATEDGRPYFVMELIRGVAITDYCDTNRLDVAARLKLFVSVCSAVQHAHQKGVIHRDIKPSNVLVTMRDGVPTPKVIDFGIAKATHLRLTEKTLFTRFGHFIGTPAYMSPEQAEMSELEVDTRTDIYSLGVLLYELITGRTPFDPQRLREAGLAGMHRIIREEEPERPSTRASTMGDGAARMRGREPHALSKLLRQELDWVVLKALEKDRTRRYDTASAFAQDLGRYLSGEEIEARPPSTGYRLAKTFRRHRVAVLTLASIMAALAVGFALALAGFIEARAQRDLARREAQRSATVLGLTEEILSPADRHSAMPQDVTLRALLDGFSARMKGRDIGDPEVEATLRATMGNAYKTLGRLDESEAELEQALALRTAAFGPGDLRTGESVEDLAWQAHDRGHYAAAESLFRASLGIFEEKAGQRDYRTAEAHHSLGDVLRHLGKYDEAQSHVERALEARVALFGESHERVAASMLELGTIARMRGEPARAESLQRRALLIKRQVLGPRDPEIATTLTSLAFTLHERDQLNEAEAAYREALGIRREVFGDRAAIVGASCTNLALLLWQQGRLEEAEKLLREAWVAETGTRRPGHPALARTAATLGGLLNERRAYAEAELFLRRAHEIRTLERPDHVLRFDAMSQLGEALAGQRRFAEAEPLLERAFRGLDADTSRAMRAAARLRDLYAAWGRPADAARWSAVAGRPGGESP